MISNLCLHCAKIIAWSIIQAAVTFALCGTCDGEIPDIFDRLAMRDENDPLPEETEPPETERPRIPVRFSGNRGYWDNPYLGTVNWPPERSDPKWRQEHANFRWTDGLKFPLRQWSGPPWGLEYRDGFMYFLDDAPTTARQPCGGTSTGVVLEYFGEPWCPACRTQKPVIDRLKASGVTVSENPGGYGGAIPHTRIRVDGKVTKQWTGFVSEQAIRSELPVEAQDGTPHGKIARILDLLPEPKVAFCDIGCGDGRILIAAARKWGKPVIGYEIDEDRAEQARRNLEAAGVREFEIIVADATELEEVDADVGYAYQFPQVLGQLRTLLTSLDAFATYAHLVPGVSMRQHGDIYAWRRPAPQQEHPGRPAGIATWYYGAWYTPDNFPTAHTCGCEMCVYLRSDWRSQGWRPG